MEGEDANLDSIVNGDAASGIPGGDALCRWAEVALGDDGAAIREAREEVRRQLGDPAAVDAAGVIANFQRMVRIADATGIPLDEPVMMLTQDIRDDLSLNAFSGSENAGNLSFAKRVIGRVLTPFTAGVVSSISKRRTPPTTNH